MHRVGGAARAAHRSIVCGLLLVAAALLLGVPAPASAQSSVLRSWESRAPRPGCAPRRSPQRAPRCARHAVRCQGSPGPRRCGHESRRSVPQCQPRTPQCPARRGRRRMRPPISSPGSRTALPLPRPGRPRLHARAALTAANSCRASSQSIRNSAAGSPSRTPNGPFCGRLSAVHHDRVVPPRPTRSSLPDNDGLSRLAVG